MEEILHQDSFSGPTSHLLRPADVNQDVFVDLVSEGCGYNRRALVSVQAGTSLPAPRKTEVFLRST